jgi:phosphoribosyl 1,2-cyclic phosphodiesterase
MSMHFAVLASGSRGNAALVQTEGPSLLIDLGLNLRTLTARLAEIGHSWDQIGAAVLTHTHGDHVCESVLSELLRRRIPLFCHPGHRDGLSRFGPTARLDAAGLLRTFEDRPFLTVAGLHVEPITLSHDGGPTFGFRIEGRTRRSRPVALGYLADTGLWRPDMVDVLAGVDILGLEFNHDVAMQWASGRSRALIHRNLGPRGHLSNVQAAELVATLLAEDDSNAPRHLVLLHLSEQCNGPELALDAARKAVKESGRRTAIHVAEQYRASPSLHVRPASRRRTALHTLHATASFPWESST